MDFDEAIRAHAEWKSTLKRYLSKPDRSLNPDDVQRDNKCKLGQWIYGEGGKLATRAEYATLKAEHARFHKAAADVVRRANAGKSTSEDVAVGSSSEFAKASTAVVTAIVEMRKHA